MRPKATHSLALLRNAIAALLAGAFALPASAAELQWIRGNADEPQAVSQPARHRSAVRTASFVAPVREPAPVPVEPRVKPRRVAKQPSPPRTRKQVAQQPPVARRQVADRIATTTDSGEVVFASALKEAQASVGVEQVCHDGACGCGSCALPEPGCAVIEPGCGCVEPGCGCAEPGCAVVEPGCACGDAGCGDCCGVVGPGYGLRRGWRLCICTPPLQNIAAFSGVQGFKNPLDGPRDRGNFGFNTGVNLGGQMAWLPIHGLGYQIGYRGTFNQLSGTQFNGGPGTSDSHTQSFVTAGLFRRNKCGWQYGVVYDHLHDERLASVDFNQVRGQLSLTNPKGGEIGFMFSAATNEEIIGAQLFQASDQYLGFYRFTAHGGGEFRLFAGGDSDSRGILGADMLAPLNHSWSINTGFRYLIADGGATAGLGSTQEGWNIGIDLMYHFRGTGKKWHNDRWRPLFNVADNGSFSVDLID